MNLDRFVEQRGILELKPARAVPAGGLPSLPL
jgi:hypothetical protein